VRLVEVDVAAGYPTLDRTIEELTRRGFTESFRVVDSRLRALGTGETLKTEDLVIREHYRFEGISDPDDMAIVYDIEGKGGVRGILADAFGVYSDPAMNAVLKDVPIRAAAWSPTCRSWHGLAPPDGRKRQSDSHIPKLFPY